MDITHLVSATALPVTASTPASFDSSAAPPPVNKNTVFSRRFSDFEGRMEMPPLLLDSAPVTIAAVSSPISSLRSDELDVSSPQQTLEKAALQGAYEADGSVLSRKPFFCTRCLTGFSTKGNLNVHLRTVHFKTYNFKCSCCERQFSTKASLIRHLKMVHYGERPFRCPYCEHSFATKACVKRHCDRRHRLFSS
mmetsp:Transcript_6385/g.19308  ORF Transcript_6385/g.19308 Transcript_6385/m.19308 type:complete len:194 (-) Transcript_6385:129-710(-)